jgi:hypothetical protein
MAPSILQVKLVDKPEISMIKYQLPIQSFISAEDSSYYIYVAPPDVKVAESIVSTPQRTVKRLIGKLGRIMDQEKIALLNESPRESLRSISELAITGYSKMTESDIRLDN